MRSITRSERAKRAAEFSPGCSERSEAEPWVKSVFHKQARVNGRRNSPRGILCRPLKRARLLFAQHYPGLRCACPGLNSAAGNAGSLNSSDFNSALDANFQTSLDLTSEGGHQSCLQ